MSKLQGKAGLIALAVLIPAIPVVIGLVIATSGSSSSATPNQTYTPVATSSATTTSSRPAPTHPSLLPPGNGAVVAVLQHSTTMRDSPDGSTLAPLGMRTEFGSPQVMSVVKHTDRWLGVLSPLAGNGKVGWIPRSAVTLQRVPWELKVSLSAHQLQVLDHGRVVQKYTIAVGATDSPTPTGRFAVTDRLTTGDPSGPYGCCILALSAEAPHAIQGWSGGNRIAIHSTPETDSIGESVSHGCMRLTLAEGQWLLNHIPLGTPTIIRS
jgi:lipoprotein-anchoring transpeptidase ErfK/SrfK